jgi:hypothetical protein
MLSELLNLTTGGKDMDIKFGIDKETIEFLDHERKELQEWARMMLSDVKAFINGVVEYDE